MSAPWVFDIGMHRGEDAAFYLKKGYRVAGFEAHPALAAYCRRRFAAELSDARCLVYQGAVLGGEFAPGRKIAFFSNRMLSTWGTASASWMQRNAMLGAESDALHVDAIDLAAVIRELGVPYYAKIDIEGYDRQAAEVFGAFPSRPAFLSMESDKVDFAALIAEIDLLCNLGYRRFMAVQQHTIPGSAIRAQTLQGVPFEHVFEEDSSGPFGPDLEGEWLDREEIIARYRSIFDEYARFGDFSPLRRTPEGRAFLAEQERVLGRPVPGWYDTHARLD